MSQGEVLLLFGCVWGGWCTGPQRSGPLRGPTWVGRRAPGTTDAAAPPQVHGHRGAGVTAIEND